MFIQTQYEAEATAGQPSPRAEVEASGPFRSVPAFEQGELDGHWIVTSLSREVGGPTVVFFDVTIYEGKTHLDLEIRDETSEVAAACGVLTVGVVSPVGPGFDLCGTFARTPTRTGTVDAGERVAQLRRLREGAIAAACPACNPATGKIWVIRTPRHDAPPEPMKCPACGGRRRLLRERDTSPASGHETASSHPDTIHPHER